MNNNPNQYNLSVNKMDDTSDALPAENGKPLFIVGPNGAGKSGLIQSLFLQNQSNAIRITAHRQNWMQSNKSPFSPQQKDKTDQNIRLYNSRINSRYIEEQPNERLGLIISNLINIENSQARNFLKLTKNNEKDEADKLVNLPTPVEVINQLFSNSNLPIKIDIDENDGIVASKREGASFSIAALSDGERGALLLAAQVLTAEQGALILIDEPERHLHASIVVPLLTNLFLERTDCAFIVSTHELALPQNSENSKTVIVRDSKVSGDTISNWDFDILEAETDFDEITMEAILGSRRKLLFVEGTRNSLDKPLYEILFPKVTVHPRETCTSVQMTVKSIKDTEALVWVEATGIVDQDQLTEEKKLELQQDNIYALNCYSIESLYYNNKVMEKIAERQEAISGNSPVEMIKGALDNFYKIIKKDSERLAARMTEQCVKDQASVQMLDWKKIKNGENLDISVDAQSIFNDEVVKIKAMIEDKKIEEIMQRYPIRETSALGVIHKALEFNSKANYESAVRKLVSEDEDIKNHLLSFFGDIPQTLS